MRVAAAFKIGLERRAKQENGTKQVEKGQGLEKNAPAAAATLFLYTSKNGFFQQLPGLVAGWLSVFFVAGGG